MEENQPQLQHVASASISARNADSMPDIIRSTMSATSENILRPLDNVNNQGEGMRTRPLPTGLHDTAIKIGCMPPRTAFSSWDEWFSGWRKLKSTEAMEEVRAKPHFYRCMSYTCPYTSTADNDFLEHLQKFHSSENLFCSYCLIRFSTPELLIKHSQKHLPSGYQCSRCVYRASTPAHVLMHWKKYHGNDKEGKVWRCPWAVPNDNVQVSEAHIPPFICNDCTFSTRNVEEFGLHQAVHPSTTCFLCKTLSPSFNHLLHHLKSHKIYYFHCYFCSFAADLAERIFHHICINHPDKPLQLCSRVDITIYNNEVQVVSEKMENNSNLLSTNTCEVSKKALNTSQRVQEKVNDIPDTTPKQSQPSFTCQHCKQVLHSKKELLNHMTFKHNQVHVFSCNMCHKNFNSQELLDHHTENCYGGSEMQAVSEKTFLYLCVFCNFTSTDISEMESHIRVESKSTPSAELNNWISKYLDSQECPNSKKLKPTKINAAVTGKTCCMCLLECSTRTDYFEHLCDHLQYHPFKCTKCPMTFNNCFTALNHGASEHSEKFKPFHYFPLLLVENWLTERVFGNHTSGRPVFFCGKCSHRNKDMKLFLKHFERRHSGCDLVIRSQRKLEASQIPHTSVVGKSMPVMVTQAKIPENKKDKADKKHSESVKISEQPKDSASLNSPANREDSVVPRPDLKEKEVPFKCSLCPFENPDLSTFQDHCKSQHKSKGSHSRKPHINDTASSKTLKKVPCRERNSKDSNKKQAHLYKCPVCGYSASSVNILNHHTKEKHSSASHRDPKPPSVEDNRPKMKGTSTSSVSSVSSSSVRRKERHVSSDTSGNELRQLPKKIKSSKPITSDEDKSSKGIADVLTKVSKGTSSTSSISSSKTDKCSSRKTRHPSSEGSSAESTSSRKWYKPSKSRRRASKDEEDSDESDPEMRRTKRESTLTASFISLSGARRKARCIISDASSDESNSAGTKCKSLASESDSSWYAEDSSEELSELVTPKKEEEYWSNYGKKPEPIDLSKLYFGFEQPCGKDVVRLSIDYYEDLLRKDVRVVLHDCRSHILTSLFPMSMLTDSE